MLARTHVIIGLSAGLLISQHLALDPASTAILTGAAVLGSLLPDIDHPQSMLGKFVPFVGALLSHRGLLHSVALPAAAAAALIAMPEIVPYHAALGLIAGYSSHIAADALTRQGVPLLWPLPYRIVLIGINTGGLIELLLMICLCFFLIFRTFQSFIGM